MFAALGSPLPHWGGESGNKQAKQGWQSASVSVMRQWGLVLTKRDCHRPHPGGPLPSVPPTRPLLFCSPSPPHPVLRALGVPSILWLNPDQTGSRFAFKGKVRMRLQEFDDQGQGCWKGETEELSSSSLAFHLLPSSKVLAIYGFRLIILFSQRLSMGVRWTVRL